MTGTSPSQDMEWMKLRLVERITPVELIYVGNRWTKPSTMYVEESFIVKETLLGIGISSEVVAKQWNLS